VLHLAPLLSTPAFKVAAAISAAVPVTPILGALAARRHRAKPLAGYDRLAPMLGFIVAPYHRPGIYPAGIQYAYGGRGQYLCPHDPQHYRRGEAGFYPDTPLGGIPTDAELARNYQYTPSVSGWVNFKEGYYSAPYIPPGWNAAGAYGPPMSLSGGSLGGVSLTDWKLWAALAGIGLAAWALRDKARVKPEISDRERVMRERTRLRKQAAALAAKDGSSTEVVYQQLLRLPVYAELRGNR